MVNLAHLITIPLTVNKSVQNTLLVFHLPNDKFTTKLDSQTQAKQTSWLNFSIIW